MANEKLPNKGRFLYQENWVGMSQKKSERGPTNFRTELIHANKFPMSISLIRI